MQEIADRAGTNKALLHYHFRDKESLYQTVLGSIVETVKQSILAVVSQAGENTPEQTIDKARRIQAAALAPAGPPPMHTILMRRPRREGVCGSLRLNG